MSGKSLSRKRRGTTPLPSASETPSVQPSPKPSPQPKKGEDEAQFEGLTVPRPLSVGTLRWADFGEEELQEQVPVRLVEAAAPIADTRPHSEEPATETDGDGDGSDWTPPTARCPQETRFPDSPPQKPSPVGPTSIDAGAEAQEEKRLAAVGIEESHQQQQQQQRDGVKAPPSPTYRRRLPAKDPSLRTGSADRPAVPLPTQVGVGGVVCTDAVDERPPAPQPPTQLRRYDPYAVSVPPVSWVPTAHASNLDGRLAYRPYHPGALREELPFFHSHDTPTPTLGRGDAERLPAPTTRLFIGHWWSEARTCVFQWMLDEFVTNPEALAVTGHCVAYEPQLHFRHGTGDFRGCMHVRLCCAQPVLVIRALHHRLLFDHAGVWYAETPEQLHALREYSRWVGSLPKWKRSELLQGLPGTPLAVEFAANP